MIARKAALEASGHNSSAATQRQGEERWAELTERASNPSGKMGNYDSEAQAAAGQLCTPALPRSATGMLNLTRLDSKVFFGGDTTMPTLHRSAMLARTSCPRRSEAKV